MVPFVAAALPALISAAPSLIRLFGNSEQSEKNARAAELVAEIAKGVTGETTIEGATNRLQADPAVVAQFQDAIQSNWYEIAEAGGGGIAAARKANAEAAARPVWSNPALLVTAAVLPLVYLVVAAVLFSEFSNDIKIMVISAVMSLGFGSVMAYFFGTTASSQRKTELMGK